jgi:hypothetical protein
MLGTGMYKVVHKTLTLTTATALAVHLPQGSKEHVFRLESPAVGWRWGTDDSTVAASGFPMEAGQVFAIEGPVELSTLQFYQASGVSVVLHWAYLQPTIR